MTSPIRAYVTGVGRGNVRVRSHSEPSITVVSFAEVEFHIGGDTRWEQFNEIRQIAKALVAAVDELCPECGETLGYFHGPGTESGRACTSCDLDFDALAEDDVEAPRPLCDLCEATMLRTVDRAGAVGHMCPKCDVPETFTLGGAA